MCRKSPDSLQCRIRHSSQTAYFDAVALVRLRVKQVNKIGVDVVHIPFLTSVQEGVCFGLA